MDAFWGSTGSSFGYVLSARAAGAAVAARLGAGPPPLPAHPRCILQTLPDNREKIQHTVAIGASAIFFSFSPDHGEPEKGCVSQHSHRLWENALKLWSDFQLTTENPKGFMYDNYKSMCLFRKCVLYRTAETTGLISTNRWLTTEKLKRRVSYDWSLY